MPESRLQRTRASLPVGYQFGDTRFPFLAMSSTNPRLWRAWLRLKGRLRK